MGDDFNSSPLIASIVILVGLFIIIVTVAIISKNNSVDGACSSDTDCRSIEKCSNGLCKFINGQSCTSDDQCLSNSCQSNLCSDPQITKQPQVKTFGSSSNYAVIPANSMFVEEVVNTSMFVEEVFNTSMFVEDVPANNSMFVEDVDSYNFHKMISPSYEVSSGNSEVSLCSGSDNIYRKVPYANVIDAVSYSTSNVYILYNNEIYRDDVKISHNLKNQVKYVVVFRGFLIVLSGGMLYALPSSDYHQSKWTFHLADSIIGEDSANFGGIIHISSTNRQDYLIIQTYNGLYVIGENGVAEEQQYSSNLRRIYGNNLNEWVEIDKSSTNQMIRFSKDGNIQTFYYITDAVIDHLGKLIPLPIHQAKEHNLTGIVILSWKPRYLYSA